MRTLASCFRSYSVKNFTIGAAIVAMMGSLVGSHPVVVAQDQEPPSVEATENSTRKIRVKPSKMAARIGTAVEWRPSVAAAMEES
ncbi:MAG: hypothetical protein Q8M16_16855, partial [Pirellulaceae bacterium]|nr:hypothetical protein [Pirellulaceae bacterium]